jgi:ribosome-binding protein aMBF1 (putative translation factor)
MKTLLIKNISNKSSKAIESEFKKITKSELGKPSLSVFDQPTNVHGDSKTHTPKYTEKITRKIKMITKMSEMGLSVIDLSRICNCAQTMISMVRSGYRKPNEELAKRIEKALGVKDLF